MKKVISIILSIVLMFSLMPMTAYAIEADTTPPVIHINTLTMTLPDGKDTVTIGDKIKFSVEVTDESEVDIVEAYYYNYAVEKGETFYFEYNAQSGKFECEKTIDNNVASGEWKLLRFMLRDNHDNYAYYYNTSYSTNEPSSDLDAFNYTVEGTNPDITPPEIHINTLTMTLPDGKDTVTIGDKIKFSVEVTDESEVDIVEAYYYNYAVEKGETFYFEYNAQSGKFECEKTIDNNVASGEWKLLRFMLRDNHDNYAYYYNTSYSTNEPSSDLDAFNYTVEGTNPDITPPVINIDTLTMTLPEGKSKVIVGDKIKFSVEATDESEIDQVEAYYYNYAVEKGESFNFTYNAQSGKFEYEYTVGENTPTGEWKLLRFWMRDSNDNYGYYYNTSYSTNEPSSDLDAFNYTVAKTCKITFNTRGGTPVDPVYVEKGKKATKPESPTKEGVNFGGWRKNPETGPFFFFDYDKVESDLTLYAAWDIPISITNWNKTTANAEGGGKYRVNNFPFDFSGCMNSVTQESDKTITLLAVPDTGYIFKGWYKGVYTGDASGQSAEPLDMNDPENLISTEKEITYELEKYTVFVAVFEECVNHDWTEHIEKATPTENGRVYDTCNICNKEEQVTVLGKADNYKLSQTSFTYNGKQRQPAVTVTNTFGDVLATNNYTVTYKNNVNAGKATAVITFKGEYYTGQKTVDFNITKANNTMKTSVKKPKVSLKKLKKKNQTFKAITVSKAQGTVTYQKTKGNSKFTVNKKTGKITVKKGTKKGTYTIKVKVSAKGNANYKALNKTVNVKITVK